MSAGVRIIRLLEYTYPDQESADRDMARWGIPANGARLVGLRRDRSDPGGEQTIRSAIIQQPWGEAEPVVVDSYQAQRARAEAERNLAEEFQQGNGDAVPGAGQGQRQATLGHP